MKVSEVTKDDIRMAAQLINMLQVGEFSLNGKDICASADTLRWFQNFAAQASKCYSEELSTGPQALEGSGISSGVTIKAMSPGKPSKK